MSRTYKDRPFWVKRNDRSRPGSERHFHDEFTGMGKNRRQTGPCTITEEVTRENVRDLTCYWEADDAYSKYCSCAPTMPFVNGSRRAEERDVMLEYKKEHRAGEEELSFEDDVFRTQQRHDYDPWWCC